MIYHHAKRRNTWKQSCWNLALCKASRNMINIFQSQSIQHISGPVKKELTNQFLAISKLYQQRLPSRLQRMQAYSLRHKKCPFPYQWSSILPQYQTSHHVWNFCVLDLFFELSIISVSRDWLYGYVRLHEAMRGRNIWRYKRFQSRVWWQNPICRYQTILSTPMWAVPTRVNTATPRLWSGLPTILSRGESLLMWNHVRIDWSGFVLGGENDVLHVLRSRSSW